MGNVTLLLEKLYWEIALFVKDELVDDGPIWATEKKKKKQFCPEKKNNFTNENISHVCPLKKRIFYTKKLLHLPTKKLVF